MDGRLRVGWWGRHTLGLGDIWLKTMCLGGPVYDYCVGSVVNGGVGEIPLAYHLLDIVPYKTDGPHSMGGQGFQ